MASVLQGSESIPHADIDSELGSAYRPNNSTFGAADSQSIDDFDNSYDCIDDRFFDVNDMMAKVHIDQYNGALGNA